MKAKNLADPMNLSTMVDELIAIKTAQYRATDNTTDEYAANSARSNELIFALRNSHGIGITQEYNDRTGRQALHLMASSDDAGILRDEWIRR